MGGARSAAARGLAADATDLAGARGGWEGWEGWNGSAQGREGRGFKQLLSSAGAGHGVRVQRRMNGVMGAEGVGGSRS